MAALVYIDQNGNLIATNDLIPISVDDATIILPVDRQAILHSDILDFSGAVSTGVPVGDGTIASVSDKDRISVVCSATVAGTLYVQQSEDAGTTWPESVSVAVVANVPKTLITDAILTDARVWFSPLGNGTAQIRAKSIA